MRLEVADVTDPTADQILQNLGNANIGWRGSELVNTGGGVMNLIVNVAVVTDSDDEYVDIHVGPFDVDGESLDGWVSVWIEEIVDGERVDTFDDDRSSDNLRDIIEGIIKLRDHGRG